MASIKEVKYDVGDTVSFQNVYDKTKIDSGVVSMITVNNKGIRYRVSYYHDSATSKSQTDLWQEEII